MSSGAVALCKHFERGASSEHGKPHPFWTLPAGSNDNKTATASTVLEQMLADAAWRNVMLLHRGVAVYEIRNSLGYGMRWTLELEEAGNNHSFADGNGEFVEVKPTTENHEDRPEKWRVAKTTFRGFLEPVEGMNHELP